MNVCEALYVANSIAPLSTNLRGLYHALVENDAEAYLESLKPSALDEIAAVIDRLAGDARGVGKQDGVLYSDAYAVIIAIREARDANAGVPAENVEASPVACPECGERDPDKLVWLDDDDAQCQCASCSFVFCPGAPEPRRSAAVKTA